MKKQNETETKINELVDLLMDIADEKDRLITESEWNTINNGDLDSIRQLINAIESESESETETSKTAVKSFKWLRIDGYKKVKSIKQITYSDITETDLVVFHFSNKVINYINRENIKMNKLDKNGNIKDIAFNSIKFVDNIDICSITDLTKNGLTVRSTKHNTVYDLLPVDFTPEAKWCLDNWLPFMIYKKA